MFFSRNRRIKKEMNKAKIKEEKIEEKEDEIKEEEKQAKLEDLTVAELKELAKDKGIPKYYELNKTELINELNK